MCARVSPESPWPLSPLTNPPALIFFQPLGMPTFPSAPRHRGSSLGFSATARCSAAHSLGDGLSVNLTAGVGDDRALGTDMRLADAQGAAAPPPAAPAAAPAAVAAAKDSPASATAGNGGFVSFAAPAAYPTWDEPLGASGSSELACASAAASASTSAPAFLPLPPARCACAAFMGFSCQAFCRGGGFAVELPEADCPRAECRGARFFALCAAAGALAVAALTLLASAEEGGAPSPPLLPMSGWKCWRLLHTASAATAPPHARAAASVAQK